MKWTLFIQQKIKIATLLFCVMFFIVITSVLSSKNMDRINESINSIYADRLVPATDVYYISDHLHNKKALLENLLLNAGDCKAAANRLRDINKKINTLVVRFEHTYLVNGESEFISEFKTNHNRYNRNEANAINLISSGNLPAAKQLFNTEIKASHERSINTLGKLISIQSKCGQITYRELKI
jgi:hypothetical protein